MPVVLIVDDNEKNRKLAGSVLSAAGFRTIEAATGAEALALAAEHVPDVILMDLRLPDMDGTEAMRTLGEAGADRSDPGGRGERHAARGERRLARGCRLRGVDREADPDRHVRRSGASVLRRSNRVKDRPRDAVPAR